MLRTVGWLVVRTRNAGGEDLDLALIIPTLILARCLKLTYTQVVGHPAVDSIEQVALNLRWCRNAGSVEPRALCWHHMLDLPPLDPIQFTRELVDIESITYHEGAVGEFLAGHLASRGWEIEKTPVPQPAESAADGDRWNVYAGISGQRPDLVFSTHMDTVPPHIQF